MATLRFQALGELFKRQPVSVSLPSPRVTDYYGELVFGKEAMQKYLSKDAYEAVLDAIEAGTTIERKISDAVALGLKSWALDKGATHYTHWRNNFV